MNKKRQRVGGRFAWVMSVLFGYATAVQAQGVGSAVQDDAAKRDQLEQRRAAERERQRREAMSTGTDVFGERAGSDAPREWPKEDLPCFVIERIELEGDKAGDFSWVLETLNRKPDGALGRCLGTEGLALAAAWAQNLLIAKGYVTSRVLLKPQDLSGGTLTLSLLPGRVSAIRFIDGTPDRATWRNAVPAEVGDLLNLRDVEQTLENLRRMPTVDADIQIAPGDEPGQSEWHIRWEQKRPVRWSFTLDDSGPRATGRYLANATLSVDHGLTLNDLFYVTAGRDLGGGDPGIRGSRNGNLHYSLPWGYWTLAINTSRSG